MLGSALILWDNSRIAPPSPPPIPASSFVHPSLIPWALLPVCPQFSSQIFSSFLHQLGHTLSAMLERPRPARLRSPPTHCPSHPLQTVPSSWAPSPMV